MMSILKPVRKRLGSGIITELKEMPNVIVKNRSQILGYYDHNMLVMSEKASDHLPITKNIILTKDYGT